MTSFLPSADGPQINSKPYDNIYVSSSNSLTSAGRVFTGQCAKISLPSKSFGPEVQVINLPQNMLLGHTQLVLKVPWDAVPDNAYLLDDWAHQAVQYYEFVFSDSERLRIDSPQLFVKNMADCESGEKKSLVSALSEVKVNRLTSVGPPPDPKVGGFYTASLSLYLPFSNLSSSRIHPFPSDILDRPVQLTIAFNPWINVLQYNDLVAGRKTAIESAISSKSYNDLYVMVKTMYMLDPSDSIREAVSMRGDNKYLYPYMYPQSFSSSGPLVGVSPGGGTPMSVNLTRFLNANLQSIDLFLLRNTLGNSEFIDTAITYTANLPLSRVPWNKNYFSKMINCRLSYAGQTIWRSDDNSDVLMNLSEYPTSTDIPTVAYAVTAPNATTIGLSTPARKSSWVHIQLSQLNERFFSNLAQCGPTLNSNEVLFEFNVLPLQEQETFGVPVANANQVQSSYTLYGVYNYMAGVRVAKGAANLVFQPELVDLKFAQGLPKM